MIINSNMKKTYQRIMKKDMESVKGLNGIRVIFDESNLLKAYALIIGPENTKYENSILLFNIFFPSNYPYNPPNVEYIPMNKIRIHPNLYASGKVCLSLLGTWSGPGWTSIMDISSILLSIQSLLGENPLRNEPGYETIKGDVNDNYNQIIEFNSINSLIIDMYNYIPETFIDMKPFIREHIIQNKDNIIKKIDKNIDTNIQITLNIYRINEHINYKTLKDKYCKFIGTI